MANELGLGILVSLRDAFSGKAKGVSSSMNEMQGKAEGTVGKLNKLQGALQAVAGAVIFQKAKQAFFGILEPAVAFDKTMAMVNSRITDSTVKISAVRDQLVGLSNNFGIDAAEAANGLTSLLTGGIEDVNTALKTMPVAIKLAQANAVSLEESTSILLNAMNAFKIAPENLAEAANMIQITAEAGTGSLRELDTAYRRAGTVAESAGISMIEFNSIIGSLRTQGLSGPKAVNTLVDALISLQDHSEELDGVMQRSGFINLKDAIQKKGLISVLDAVVTKFQDNKEVLQELGLTGAGFNNMLQITGKNFGVFSKTVDQLRDDTKTLETTWEKATNNAGHHWARFTQQIKNTRNDIGESIILAIAPVLPILKEWSEKLSVLIHDHPNLARAIGLTILGLTGLAATLGLLAVAITVLEIVAAPITLVFLVIGVAIGLLVWQVYRIYKQIQELKKQWVEFGPGVKAAWNSFTGWFTSNARDLVDSVVQFWDDLREGVTTAVNMAIDGVKWLWNAFNDWTGGWAGRLFDLYVNSWIFIGQAVSSQITTIIEGAKALWTGFKDWIGGLFEGIKQMISDSLNFITDKIPGFERAANRVNNSMGIPTGKEVDQETFDASRSRVAVRDQHSTLSAIRNPNLISKAPQINNVINIPPSKIEPAEVKMDGKVLAKIIFEQQQLQAVRGAGR